jgi:hypothetical protein
MGVAVGICLHSAPSRQSWQAQIIVAAYKAQPEFQRAAARDCKERLQAIILDTRRKGFSETAIDYAVLGPLSKSHAQVFRTSLSPERAEEEAGEVREILFAALKKDSLAAAR